MNWNPSIRAVVVLASALQCGNVLAADARTVNIHKAADADGTVDIENVAGHVAVSGWDRADGALDETAPEARFASR